LRDPRRDDHMICTAMAPELVFAARTYATNAPYEATASAQIRTSHTANSQVIAVQSRGTSHSDKSQVGGADEFIHECALSCVVTRLTRA
jgi:hypothetical protein